MKTDLHAILSVSFALVLPTLFGCSSGGDDEPANTTGESPITQSGEQPMTQTGESPIDQSGGTAEGSGGYDGPGRPIVQSGGGIPLEGAPGVTEALTGLYRRSDGAPDSQYLFITPDGSFRLFTLDEQQGNCYGLESFEIISLGNNRFQRGVADMRVLHVMRDGSALVYSSEDTLDVDVDGDRLEFMESISYEGVDGISVTDLPICTAGGD